MPLPCSIPLPAALRSSGLHCGPSVIPRLTETVFPIFLTAAFNTNPYPIPYGARTPRRPFLPMATAVTSLWALLPSRVRSRAVAKGTGGCEESGSGGPWGGERCGLSKAPTGVGRKRPQASWRVAGGRGLPSPSSCPAPSLPLFAAAEWTRRGGGRGTAASAPPQPRPGPAP